MSEAKIGENEKLGKVAHKLAQGDPMRHALGTWGAWADEAEARITEAGPKAVEAVRQDACNREVEAARDDTDGIEDVFWIGHPGWKDASVRKALMSSGCVMNDEDTMDPTDEDTDEADDWLIRLPRR